MKPERVVETRVALATTEEEIARCHPVMQELRPHRNNSSEFVAQVQRQQREGFELAFVEAEGEVRAVAGFRMMELLFSGKTLYVDDLVTRESDRSRGFGGNSSTGLSRTRARRLAKRSVWIPVFSVSRRTASIC